jgi:transcription antitermination factor NusG
MNWYVLYTASRAEKQVEQRLRADGIETFLPLHLSPRKWSDRVKLVEVPLFSSYIFVKTTDEVLRTLLRMTGIARIVYYNGSPAIIKQKEIESIQLFVESACGKECSFGLEDEVLVACGPLKDISGKIKKIANDYVVLHIEQMGISLSINLNQIIKKQ